MGPAAGGAVSTQPMENMRVFQSHSGLPGPPGTRLKRPSRPADNPLQRPSLRRRRIMKRILLIEDNHSLREEIVNVLDLEGFEVVTAENGRKGLERLTTEQVDLVLC